MALSWVCCMRRHQVLSGKSLLNVLHNNSTFFALLKIVDFLAYLLTHIAILFSFTLNVNDFI